MANQQLDLKKKVISSKYERPTYKRKYVKSPHKYSYMRDAQ